MGIFKSDGTRVTKAAFPSAAVPAGDVPKVVTEELFTTKKYDLRNDTKADGQIRTRLAKPGDALTQKEIDALFPTPVITRVVPATGPAAGGTLVTIEGEHFEDVASVKFGGTAGTELTVQSDNVLTVKTPAGVAGAADVVVADSDDSATKAGGYTYA